MSWRRKINPRLARASKSGSSSNERGEVALPIGALFMVLVLGLALIGVGYGLWFKVLTIEGTVVTGEVHAAFEAAFTDDDGEVNDPEKDSNDVGNCPIGGRDISSCDPAASGRDPKPRYEKDVGWCGARVDGEDNNVGHVNIRNGYPSYFCTAWFDVLNDGSIPVKVASVTINGTPVTPSVATPFDLDGDGNADVDLHVSEIQLCQQIEPDETVQMDIDQHVRQEAAQNATFEYTVEVQLNQFNETACGLLFIGSDTEEFEPDVTPPDRLGVASVQGSTAVAVNILETEFDLNGLAPSGVGTLFSGDPFSSAHNEISTSGTLLNSVTGPLDTECCNEDLAFDGMHVWRADFNEGPLFQYLPDGTPVNTYDQRDVVGATFVEGTLWITKWAGRQVGPFDPATNTFTARIDTETNAGGLAYDAASQILWVGRQGGFVEAYDLSDPLNPELIDGSAFQPFGDMPDTIDGLAFFGN